MSKKLIYTVGFQILGNDSTYISFNSLSSLLDADIIVFQGNIDFDIYNTDYFNDTYLGKPSLNEKSSFALKEYSTHWYNELNNAYKAGKTIFIILNKRTEVYVKTGDKKVSGTGKNARVTNYVDLYDNYKCIPFNCDVTNAKGNIIKTTECIKYLNNYWNNFKDYSNYEVYINNPVGEILFATKTGDKALGMAIYGDSSKKEGNIFFLPNLDYKPIDFMKTLTELNEKGLQFEKKLVNCLVEIDKAIHIETSSTPAPDWVASVEYNLTSEKKHLDEISIINKKIEQLKNKKCIEEEKLNKELYFKRLLYEKGKVLENAIVESLKLLGFKAKSYVDSSSEFDVIFESSEGSFLGEAEGKDNKAVDVTKIRQLITNTQEYYEKFDIYPNAVLFGNAYRFQVPFKRGDFFTDKCLEVAKRNHVTLIRTTDLFDIIKYLKNKNDTEFKKKCRQAIFSNDFGIVKFPEIPDAVSK